MLRFVTVASAAVVLLSLAGCVTPEIGPVTPPQELAPPIPVDNRPKATFEEMTGINSDAVAAISGDAQKTYVYFDLFAAHKDAVTAAPARVCSHYGKSLKASHVAEPGDRVPGMKALVVECS